MSTDHRPGTSSRRITPDDIKSKLAAIQNDATTTVTGARNNLVAAGAGITLLLVVIAFFLGRRAGIHKNTIIEVRRA